MMRAYKEGTIVRLSPRQPKGSGLLKRYPDMRGVVTWGTLGMTRVEWHPEGTTPGVILHYNTEIIRCNNKSSNEQKYPAPKESGLIAVLGTAER